MRTSFLKILAIALVMSACGPKKDKAVSEDPVGTEPAEAPVPGIENLAFVDTIRLTANENMVFDKDLFKIRRNTPVWLTLKNTQAKSPMAMVHNVVILQKGTDIVDFGEAANNAKHEDYIPAKFASSVVAHTKPLGGQEYDAITFTIAEPGVYDFICSYPGHWGTMQGKIVVE